MRITRTVVTVMTLVGLLGLMPVSADDDKKLEGSVELGYRSVSVDGSQNKYNEDFDGLSSGTFISNLFLNWIDPESKMVDYARLEVIGLGGEPYEQTGFRIGRSGDFDLSFKQRKQDYIYNLFAETDDVDGHAWDTRRETTDLGLKLYPTDNVQLIFEYQDSSRTGDSIFLKDLNREVFFLEAPVDYGQKLYTAGVDVQIGQVDLIARQTRRRYSNHFENIGENNLGEDPTNNSALYVYDWIQNESGSADLTQLTVHAPLGERVDLTVGIYGTLFGEEERRSRVHVNADGTTFTRACSVSGVSCSSDADCDPITFPGDSCEPAPFGIIDGFSDADLELDQLVYDVDLSVFVADPVSLHFQYRSLTRDLTGASNAALNGGACAVTGTPCGSDADCDPLTPGDVCVVSPSTLSTMTDYSLDTMTALVDYRPLDNFGLTLGYRMIDRELTRDGYGGLRDQDFESKGDSTLVFGVNWKPADWVRLSADYEDGDVDMAFNAPSVLESERLRLRATFTPKPDMNVGLHYLDFENTNDQSPFRSWYGSCSDTGSVCDADSDCNVGATCNIAPFDSMTEGTQISASFWHKASEKVDYLFRYAEQEVSTFSATLFDGAGFGGPAAFESGATIYDNTSTQWTGQINYAWNDRWRAFLRVWMAEADGDNILANDVMGNFSNTTAIDQDFTDYEVGATYTFPGGVWVGATLRDFDYDDVNDLLDYEGQTFVVRGGVRF